MALLLLPLQTFSFGNTSSKEVHSVNIAAKSTYRKWITEDRLYLKSQTAPKIVNYNDGVVAGRLERRNIVAIGKNWVTYRYSGYCSCINNQCPTIR